MFLPFGSNAQDFLLASSADSIRDFYLVDKKIKDVPYYKNYREIWIKILPGPRKKSLFKKDKLATLKDLDLPTKGYDNYSHSLQRWVIDTASEKYTILDYVDYNETGNVLDSESTEIYSWENIVPGSVAESIYESIKYLDIISKLKRSIKKGVAP